MNSSNIRFFTEEMTEDEVAYLKGRLSTERKSYFKVVRIAYLLGIIVPLIFAVFISLFVAYGPKSPKALDYEPVTLNKIVWMISLGSITLWLIITIALWMSYRLNIRPLAKDIKYKTKIIEIAVIDHKKYMPQNDSYHFYLSESTKVSVEVDEPMYHELKEGDEINFEYAPHSKIEFGTF